MNNKMEAGGSNMPEQSVGDRQRKLMKYGEIIPHSTDETNLSDEEIKTLEDFFGGLDPETENTDYKVIENLVIPRIYGISKDTKEPNGFKFVRVPGITGYCLLPDKFIENEKFEVMLNKK